MRRPAIHRDVAALEGGHVPLTLARQPDRLDEDGQRHPGRGVPGRALADRLPVRAAGYRGGELRIGDHDRTVRRTATGPAPKTDDDTLRIVLAAMLASAGRQQGWLPEADYDRLRSMTDTTGAGLDVLLGEIRRGRPAGA
jgi:hypothetical protein